MTTYAPALPMLPIFVTIGKAALSRERQLHALLNDVLDCLRDQEYVEEYRREMHSLVSDLVEGADEVEEVERLTDENCHLEKRVAVLERAIEAAQRALGNVRLT